MPPAPLHSSRDVGAVTRTLVEAFSHDAAMEWLFPEDLPDRAKGIENFFCIRLEMFFAHGGVAWATADHEAVMVWTPPGEPNLSPQEQHAYHELLKTGLGDAYPRVALFLKTLDEQEPATLPAEHVHLMWAARRPDHSVSADFRAITTALRDAVIQARVDLYAMATSPRNLQLWERLGLERIGEEIRLPDGGPVMYPIFGNVNGRTSSAPVHA
ncbi:hypothetical protein [Streptomyces sp. NPDC055085]